MKHYLHIAGVCLLSSVALGAAHAAVSAEEAAKLKTELTPLGAERAGNKDGTIPAWAPEAKRGAPKPGACRNHEAQRMHQRRRVAQQVGALVQGLAHQRGIIAR